MTVSLLTRTAFVTVATGAVLLSGLTVAGAASAKPVDDSVSTTTTVSSDSSVLKRPTATVTHGRKIG